MYTTPYEFGFVKSLLPNAKINISVINSIIDFALSIPQLKMMSPQALFFGALMYGLKNTGNQCACKNEEMYEKIIKAITVEVDNAIKTLQTLQQNMGRLLKM